MGFVLYSLTGEAVQGPDAVVKWWSLLMPRVGITVEPFYGQTGQELLPV